MVSIIRKKFILIFILLLCIGCEKVVEAPTEEKKDSSLEEVVGDVIVYQDENTTPISFYFLRGNTLTKVHSVRNSFQPMDDVELFQIYPSTEEKITLSSDFASSYYQEWNSYVQKRPIKLGFSLSFTLANGEEVFYNIFNPINAMEKWEYFMAYLYDDYANLGGGFYSHLEPTDYTDNTLITAIKLQCGAYLTDVHSPVTLTVYTYDSEDDFLEGHYRGNSQYSITICTNPSYC